MTTLPRLELEGLAFRERARADTAEARLAEAEKALAHRRQELVVQSKAADRWCREAEEYRDRLVEAERALQDARECRHDVDDHSLSGTDDGWWRCDVCGCRVQMRADAAVFDKGEPTGSCEDDCQVECAYPGQFAECGLPPTSG